MTHMPCQEPGAPCDFNGREGRCPCGYRSAAPPKRRHPVPDHIPEHLREAFATCTGREIPPHAPYKAGDPVRLRGSAGYPDPGFRRTGFRGWAVATVGATILTGITSDGEEWAEYWGSLQADTPVTESRRQRPASQTPRAHKARSSSRAEASNEQLDLFGQEVTP